MCAMIILVACVGKFGGSAIAARLTGLNWRESSAIGILMNTRGLMELIVLNIGLDLGVISPRLFTMMVLMALVTTFMTTPLLQRIYPIEELAKTLAEPVSELAEPAYAKPYTAMVCVSLEQSGPSLMTLAAAIAGTHEQKSRLYALSLVPIANRASFVLEQQSERQSEPAAEPAFAPLLARASELGASVRPLTFVTSQPAQDICEVSTNREVDLLLLGWHKPLLGRTMLSGTVHQVMTNAAADVGVLVDRGLKDLKRILVPYLGSEHDRAALALARRIGENIGANITVLHIVVPERQTGSLGAQESLRQEFRDGAGPAQRFDVVFKVMPHAVPSEAVIDESARGYDLVLIGAGKEWGLEHRSFGLQREAILARAKPSVLVVRKGEPVAVPAEAESLALAGAQG
jgi:nucleotide-binding universal stress UspA family protein